MTFSWDGAGAVALVAIIAGAQLFIFRQMVGKAIADNNNTLLQRINGTYVKSEVLNEKLKTVTWRLDHLEGDD